MTWAAGGSDKPVMFFAGVLCSFSLTMRDFVSCTDICMFLCCQRLTIYVLVLLYFYSINNRSAELALLYAVKKASQIISQIPALNIMSLLMAVTSLCNI